MKHDDRILRVTDTRDYEEVGDRFVPIVCAPEPYLRQLQFVRVLDVVAIGPAMIWAAVVVDKMPTWARVFLGACGAGTILFNYERWKNARL